MANTLTENYGLLKPADGDDGWDLTLNTNLDTIDELIYQANQALNLGAYPIAGLTFIDSVTGVHFNIKYVNGIQTTVEGGPDIAGAVNSISFLDNITGNIYTMSYQNGVQKVQG